MKKLEITTESGTYLVMDLPDGARNIYILESIEILDTKTLPSIKYSDWLGQRSRCIPEGNWQLIGFGNDYPKLVEEIGLLSENPYGLIEPVCGETCACADNCYAYTGWHKAESKVFKNPVILKKQ